MLLIIYLISESLLGLLMLLENLISVKWYLFILLLSITYCGFHLPVSIHYHGIEV